jgi:hypothetical protein
MNWAQRLKRVFQLDLQSCEGCGGQVRLSAGRQPEVRGLPPARLELGWIRTSAALLETDTDTDRPGHAAPVGVCSAIKWGPGGDTGVQV